MNCYRWTSLVVLLANVCGAAARSLRNRPMKDRPTLRMVTCDTESKESTIKMKGVPGLMLQNACRKLTWKGHETKRDAYINFLSKEAATDPNQILVVVDPDVAFAGCTHDELMQRYNATVLASGGAPTVWGAQLGFWPPMLRFREHKYHLFSGVKGRILRQKRLGGERHYSSDQQEQLFQKFANCTDADSECSTPVQYKYINIAFQMGPARSLLSTWTCMRDIKLQYSTYYENQQQAAECMFNNQKEATLDYLSSLALSTFEFNEGVLQAPSPDGRHVKNMVTGESQCFLHLNALDDQGSTMAYWRRVSSAKKLLEQLENSR